MPKHDMKAALKAASRTQQSERFDAAAADITASGSGDQAGQLLLPVSQIRANPHQPRQEFDQDALEELAASIRELGILQPLAVRRAPDGCYDLIAGERRLRAGKIAGLEAIPAIVLALDDQVSLEASLTENLQREDLSPLEEAVVFKRMVDELGYSIRRLAERLGKGKGYVEDRLRLTRMAPDLQQLVSGRPDTLTHAREIEKVQDPDLREELIRKVEADQMPLQELRKRIRSKKDKLGVSTTRIRSGTELSEPESVVQASQQPGAEGNETDILPQPLISAPATGPSPLPSKDNESHSLTRIISSLRHEIENAQLPAAPEMRSLLIADLQVAAALIQQLLEKL